MTGEDRPSRFTKAAASLVLVLVSLLATCFGAGLPALPGWVMGASAVGAAWFVCFLIDLAYLFDPFPEDDSDVH